MIALLTLKEGVEVSVCLFNFRNSVYLSFAKPSDLIIDKIDMKYASRMHTTHLPSIHGSKVRGWRSKYLCFQS